MNRSYILIIHSLLFFVVVIFDIASHRNYKKEKNHKRKGMFFFLSHAACLTVIEAPFASSASNFHYKVMPRQCIWQAATTTHLEHVQKVLLKSQTATA